MDENRNGDVTRRRFIGASMAAVCGSGSIGSLRADDTSSDSKNNLPLTIAGYPYERVRALLDGRVKIPGCDIRFETARIGELNQHVFAGPQTRDVTEVGLVPYLLAFCNGGLRDYQLLPIFALKVFRHKSIFVRRDAGITKPEDLRGRKVATVGYSSSGLTWIRGVLQDEYGIKPEDLNWVVVGKDSASEQTGGVSKWEKQLPSSLSLTQAPEGKDESDLLLSGEVDAILHPAEPQAYVDGNPRIERLFPDPRSVESAYFAKTGIFPIMHLIAIRSALAKEQPWLPKAVFEAYVAARDLDYQEMRRIRWAYSSLPWYGQELNRTRELMGNNFYSYGIKSNRKTLETAFRYLDEQGLAHRRLTISELFEPSTLDLHDE